MNTTSLASLYNWEMEKTLLGGLIQDPSQFEECRLLPEDFHRATHRALFSLLAAKHGRGDSWDIAILLTDTTAIQDFGGIAYVATLPNACPSVENLTLYAQRLRELTVRRKWDGLLSEARQGVREKPDMGTVIADADRLMRELASSAGRVQETAWKHISDAVGSQVLELRADVARQKAGTALRLQTGFPALDKILRGISPGLCIFAARPAMGKTALMLNLAVNVAKRGTGVGIFTLEMPTAQLAERFLSSASKVAGERIRDRDLSILDWQALNDAAHTLGQLPMWLDDESGLTLDRLKRKVRALKAAQPDLGLIVLDYLQLLAEAPGDRRSRQEVVSEASRELHTLSTEIGVPIIAISQLNRSCEERPDKRPMMSDLRESGAIEQNASVILALYRDHVYHPDRAAPDGAEVLVLKNRHGSTATAKLLWDAATMQFSSRPEQTEIPA